MIEIHVSKIGVIALLGGLRARGEELRRALRHHIGGYTKERKEELDENERLVDQLKKVADTFDSNEGA